MSCPRCFRRCESEYKFCPACGAEFGAGRQEMGDELVGTVLPGGVAIRERIALGGMGCVYRAEQTTLGRTVAVKVIHPHLLGDEEVEKRFITEARAASRINHPNSVSVIDFGRVDDRFFLVMEYLRGQDLASFIAEQAPVAPRRVAQLLLDILAALDVAHELGIVHRDLKPDNIMVETLNAGSHTVKVLDFGLALVREELARTSGGEAKVVCGTTQYMAPEQARGHTIDQRVDLYACGVIGYEMLTGRLPYDAMTPDELISMHDGTLPADPRDSMDGDETFAQVVDALMRAMARDARSRYTTATQMSEALIRALQVSSTPVPSSQDARPCPRCETPVLRSQRFCGQCGTKVVRQRARPSSAGLSLHEDPPSQRGFPLPLVGRQDELDWLLSCWAEETGFRGRSIVGAAGVGKTRLLTTFATTIEQQGGRVIWVRPDPWWAGVGYFSLRELLVRLGNLPADHVGSEHWAAAYPEARAGLAQIFECEQAPTSLPSASVLPSSVAGVPASDGVRSANQQRQLVVEALRWALGYACEQAVGPLTIIIDDFDHIDGASRNALCDLMQEPPLESVLFVAAHDEQFALGWDGVPSLMLGGLSHDVARTVVQGDEMVLRHLELEGEIIPLHIEQLQRFAIEGGNAPPGALADLVTLRLERLPADARRLLQAIAVVGDGAHVAHIVALVPELGDMGRHLQVLRRCGLVELDEDRASVAHPLLRKIVMGMTPRTVRRQLHGRARHDCGVDTLRIPLEAHALHAYYADEVVDALFLLERCGVQAMTRGDTMGAVTLFDAALQLAHDNLGGDLRDDALEAVAVFGCHLAQAHAYAGRSEDAASVLHSALSHLASKEQLRPRVLAQLAQLAHVQGERDGAAAYVDEALAIARRHDDGGLAQHLERLNASFASAGA